MLKLLPAPVIGNLLFPFSGTMFKIFADIRENIYSYLNAIPINLVD